MSRRLREEVDRYRRYERPLALVLIGQDPLQPANAHHRQHLSDYVLCWMARLLSEDVRTMDLLARYGHDELAIILPETPAEGAYVVGERIRRRIAAHPCLVEQDGRAPVAVPITVSVGVASASVGVRSEAGLVSAAVLALNEARQLRNSTSLFGVRRQ
jgi:diguanylate cyclase (GGDEF)-like protein